MIIEIFIQNFIAGHRDITASTILYRAGKASMLFGRASIEKRSSGCLISNFRQAFND